MIEYDKKIQDLTGDAFEAGHKSRDEEVEKLHEQLASRKRRIQCLRDEIERLAAASTSYEDKIETERDQLKAKLERYEDALGRIADIEIEGGPSRMKAGQLARTALGRE